VLLKRLHPAASTVATANANDTKRRFGALTSALASERAETRLLPWSHILHSVVDWHLE
jgi:hypothetical protein